MDVVGKPTDSRRKTKNLIVAGGLGGDDVTVAGGWRNDETTEGFVMFGTTVGKRVVPFL